MATAIEIGMYTAFFSVGGIMMSPLYLEDTSSDFGSLDIAMDGSTMNGSAAGSAAQGTVTLDWVGLGLTGLYLAIGAIMVILVAALISTAKDKLKRRKG